MEIEKLCTVIMMDKNIGELGVIKTDKIYEDISIDNVEGFEERFLFSKTFTMDSVTDVFVAHRLPKGTDEESFLRKYKEQLEKLNPVAIRKQKQKVTKTEDQNDIENFKEETKDRIENVKGRKTSHKLINTTQKYIEEEPVAKTGKISYFQLENEIFKMLEELDERIYEEERGDKNEKLIFQFHCEKRGMEKVLEIIEIQKGNREIL